MAGVGRIDELHFRVSKFEHRDPERRMQEGYRRKYFALKRKCDSLELSNERVLNRLCHVKKYIHKLSRERRGLAKKLTELGDEFKKSDLTVPLEDDLPGGMLGVSESPNPSFYPDGDGMGGASPAGLLAGGSQKLEDAAPTNQPSSGQGKSTKKKRSREAGKSEREKDPNAPKKPANAFLMYCQQERQKVQDGAGNGIYSSDISHQELTRQLAKQWKFLSEDEKKHYYLMYEKEKDRYDKAVKRYAKSIGMEKKSVKVEDDGESETIDVVKLGQERDVGKKTVKEEKMTLKAASSEDQTIDVERDEFEFTDYPIEVDDPKISLEKIDKSKLFDKTRLYGLSSDSKSDYEMSSKPVRDLVRMDLKMPPKPVGADFKSSSVLEVKTGRIGSSPMSTQVTAKTVPGVQIKPSVDCMIKELVGVRTSSSFELIRNHPMMELKSKSGMEDRTVLVSTLKGKPAFDMKMRSNVSSEGKPKPSADLKGQGSSDNKNMVAPETKNKIAVEIRNRMATDVKSKLVPDSKPRVFSEVKPKPAIEVRNKPSAVETRGTFSSDMKVKLLPEVRRVSLDNKRPVIELKKFAVDPSDDPYHFDD